MESLSFSFLNWTDKETGSALLFNSLFFNFKGGLAEVMGTTESISDIIPKESDLIKPESGFCACSEDEKTIKHNKKENTCFTYKLFAAKIDAAGDISKSN